MIEIVGREEDDDTMVIEGVERRWSELGFLGDDVP